MGLMGFLEPAGLVSAFLAEVGALVWGLLVVLLAVAGAMMDRMVLEGVGGNGCEECREGMVMKRWIWRINGGGVCKVLYTHQTRHFADASPGLAYRLEGHEFARLCEWHWGRGTALLWSNAIVAAG